MQPATAFLASVACRIVVLRLFMVNIKARHKIPECLNTNLSWIHLIAFYIFELKYFHFTQFLLIAHQQLIDLEKVKTQNLKFRTDLQDQVMDGWSVTH